MQRREAAAPRRRLRVGVRLEQVPHDLAALEERRETERREAVRRRRVRQRRILADELAYAVDVSGGGRLEHRESRAASKDRGGDVDPASVERGQEGRETVRVARVDESAVAREKTLDAGHIARLDRHEQLARHCRPPCD